MAGKKYNLDSEEFANPKDRPNFVPRHPARMRAKILGYEEFETDTDIGMQAEFEITKILHLGTAAFRKTDRQWFDPAPDVGDRVIYRYGRKAKFAQDIARKGHEHRLFLAAAYDKEHTPELSVNRYMQKLAAMHEEGELEDAEIEIVLDFVVQKISKAKETDDGSTIRYVNGTLKAYGLSHVPPLKKTAAADDEDEDDEPAPKRTASKKRKPIDEDDEPASKKRKPIDEDDEPAPKRTASKKRKPIDEDEDEDEDDD